MSLLAIINEPLRAVSSSGELAGSCPLCRARTGDGGRDRFHVNTSENWWFCRQCHPRRGDAPGFLMARDGISYPEALRQLGLSSQAWRPTPPAPVPAREDPSPEWQVQAAALAECCAAFLWTPAAERALVWLRGRGLEDETLKRWGLGFCPGGTLEGFDRLPRAVVIPWREGGTCKHIHFRLPAVPGAQKYSSLPGGRPGIYGADLLQGKPALFLVEGEFDCMAFWQTCGDLADVLTLGSVSAPTSPAEPFILQARRLFVCFDSDPPGDQGAEKIILQTRRAQRVTVPAGKDITEALLQIGPDALRRWVQSLLDRESSKIRTEAQFAAALAENDPQNGPKNTRQEGRTGFDTSGFFQEALLLFPGSRVLL